MRLVLTLFLLILLSSCIEFEQVERDPDSYSLYSYYLNADEFAYTLTGEVERLPAIPKLILTMGDSWTYQYKGASLDVNNTSQQVTITVVGLTDSTAQFTINGTATTVLLRDHYYVGTLSGALFTESPAHFPLPIPHSSQLEAPYLSPCIRMEDGSYAYSLKDEKIFSETYGILGSSPCLLSYNGSSYTPIGKTIREFKVREAAWLQ